MKNKRVFLLIAAVAVMGLLSGCPDAPKTTGGDNVTVKFNTDGGDPAAIPSITLKKGESMGNQYPSDPTMEDHHFGGWYSGSTLYTADTPINASITLKAKWIHESEVLFFRVTFNPAGGSTVSTIQVIQYTSLGNKYPIPTYPEALKEFAGWWLNLGAPDEQEITAGTVIESNITVRAKWNDIPVTVSFNTDGGSPAAINPITLIKGDTLGERFPAAPTKNEYLFGGWYAADDTGYANIYLAATRIMANVTLKARWVDLSGATLHTVTFDRNNTDTTGFTNADPATLDIPEGMPIVTLPTPPTRSGGWSAGLVFDGWYTAPDGAPEGGTAVTGETIVESAMIVYARWKFQAGTPQVVDDTLVHIAPEIQSGGSPHGTWSGSISEEDGSATYSGGSVRYAFPDDIGDYDFFTLELIARSEAGGNMGSNILKQYNTTVDYVPHSGGNQYPTLTQNTLTSFGFEIRGAGNTGGIAIQNNGGGGRTIKFTKVTFTKGTRVQITFDTDGGSPVDSITAVVTTAIGSLPASQKSGFTFAGWVDESNVAVTPTTVVAGTMTLTAKWTEAVPVTPITVDFTAANVTATGGSSSNVTETGFRFTKTANYRGGWAKFQVTLPEGATLGSYGSVTFTIQGQDGDTSFKEAWLLAGKPLPTSFNADPNSLTSIYNIGLSGPTITGSPQTINIDAAKVTGLTGIVQFCFYIHAEASVWDFSNVTFNVRQ